MGAMDYSPASSSEEMRNVGITLERVTPDNFSNLWPLFKDLLIDACTRSNGRFDPNSAIEKMAQGHWQFWVGLHADGIVALGVTELLTYPTGLKVGNVVIATGDNSSRWVHFMDELKDWARGEECHKMQTLARKGWAKKLPEFKMTHVLLEVDL